MDWVGRSLAGRFMERHFLLRELAPVWGQCGVLDLGNWPHYDKIFMQILSFHSFLLFANSKRTHYDKIMQILFLLFANSKRKYYDKIMQILFFNFCEFKKITESQPQYIL